MDQQIEADRVDAAHRFDAAWARSEAVRRHGLADVNVHIELGPYAERVTVQGGAGKYRAIGGGADAHEALERLAADVARPRCACCGSVVEGNGCGK